MCGRYNITKKLVTVEKELDLKVIQSELFDNLVNIAPGNYAPIITHLDPKTIEFCQFGLTPAWAKKRMYVFNARAEGDQNQDNQTQYAGELGIFAKPMFRKPIRSQRCLVLANSFVEGSTQEKLNKPYLIFREDFAIFTFGGIWDEWIDQTTGEVVRSFAIITTAANSITQKVDHHRAPLIISPENRELWLNPDTDLNTVKQFLKPFDGADYNAYAISPDIKNPRNKDIHTLLPVAPAIKKQKELKIVEEIELLGMGESRAKKRRENES